MYTCLSSVITGIVRFTNQHQIEADFHIHTVGDLQGANSDPAELWSRFEGDAGVYIIFDVAGGEVHYIGMSEQDTGTRLFQWLFKENKVKSALNTCDLVLSIVMPGQPYMAPALESYLIQKLSPKLNKRGNSSHTLAL